MLDKEKEYKDLLDLRKKLKESIQENSDPEQKDEIEFLLRRL